MANILIPTAGLGYLETLTALTPSDAGSGDRFGWSVAVSGNGLVMVVGARSWLNPTLGLGFTGVVYTYDLINGSWVERAQKLVHSNASGAADAFGTGLSLSDDGAVLVAAADLLDTGPGIQHGAMYTFDIVGVNWVERSHILTASDASTNDRFGLGGAISGDALVLAVGVPLKDGGGFTNDGAVYTYDWDGSNWIERTPILTGINPATTDQYGRQVALSYDGSLLVVGAVFDEVAPFSNHGTVYTYDWNGSNWIERTQILVASDFGGNDRFGVGLSLSADAQMLVVGAFSWDGPAGVDQGIVYIFDQLDGLWVERAQKLTASDASASDDFSRDVAITNDGRTIAVAASDWDGPAGGNQGAVYVFDLSSSLSYSGQTLDLTLNNSTLLPSGALNYTGEPLSLTAAFALPSGTLTYTGQPLTHKGEVSTVPPQRQIRITG